MHKKVAQAQASIVPGDADSKTDMVGSRPESSKMRVRLDESSHLLSKDNHMSALSNDEEAELMRLREENGELKARLRNSQTQAEDAPLGMTTFSPARRDSQKEDTSQM